MIITCIIMNCAVMIIMVIKKITVAVYYTSDFANNVGRCKFEIVIKIETTTNLMIM